MKKNKNKGDFDLKELDGSENYDARLNDGQENAEAGTQDEDQLTDQENTSEDKQGIKNQKQSGAEDWTEENEVDGEEASGGEEDTEEEEGTEEGEEGDDFKTKVKKITSKVKDYLKDGVENVDQEVIMRYTAAAIVAIYGLRKGGIIGSLLLSASVSLITKYLMKQLKEQEESGAEVESDAEAVAA